MTPRTRKTDGVIERQVTREEKRKGVKTLTRTGTTRTLFTRLARDVTVHSVIFAHVTGADTPDPGGSRRGRLAQWWGRKK